MGGATPLPAPWTPPANAGTVRSGPPLEAARPHIVENSRPASLVFTRLCRICSRFSTDKTQSLPRSGRSWATDSPRSLVLWCSGSHQEASRNGKPDESRGRKAIGPSVRFPPDHGSLVPEMKRRLADLLSTRSPHDPLPDRCQPRTVRQPSSADSSPLAACQPWEREHGLADGAPRADAPFRRRWSQSRLTEAVAFVPSLPAAIVPLEF